MHQRIALNNKIFIITVGSRFRTDQNAEPLRFVCTCRPTLSTILYPCVVVTSMSEYVDSKQFIYHPYSSLYLLNVLQLYYENLFIIRTDFYSWVEVLSPTCRLTL